MAEQIPNNQFLAGVVEGFYGTPWTKEERSCLFQRMYRWRLQYYMYAPKDDCKHRADWREAYTEIELATFKQLHLSAEHNNVEFIYALSPGLNVSFSNPADRKSLLDKLKQLQSVGIKSFAILFDDIERNLSEEDSDKFSSAAEAQADLTNEIYLQTGEPRVFLFCPTEYCGSHVSEADGSPYLSVIGEKLHTNIRIMWTGNRVISNRISTKSIKKLIKIIKRRPVIWDNLHANDYDQRRLYIGPYAGRSMRLLAYLSGILSNPNNEFEMNYVPLYTLGAYCRCYNKACEAALQADSMEIDTSPVGVDLSELDLKESNEDVQEEATKPAEKTDIPQDMDVISGDETKPGSLYEPRSAMITALEDWIPYFYVCSLQTPTGKAEVGLSSMDTELVGSVVEVEMECERALKPVSEKYRKYEGRLTVEDLSLLCDLFYLPSEHGLAADELLQEAVWLKEYGFKMHQSCHKEEKAGMDKMWQERIVNFHQMCERVVQLGVRLVQISNRELFRQIHPYFWDCKETILLFDSFLKWMAQAKDGVKSFSYLPKDSSCLSGGGLTGDLQRLLPHVEHSTELYSFKKVPNSSLEIITIRPYQEDDRSFLYSVCLKSQQEDTDDNFSFQNFPDIIGDIRVIPYLEFSPDLCFVAEDNWGVCGYIMATCDSSEFYKFLMDTWLPKICKKYPCPEDGPNLTPEEEFCLSLYQTKIDMTSRIFTEFPSHFQVELITQDRCRSLLTRMVLCILSVLKAKGSKGIHVEVEEENKDLCQFYLNIGFKKLEESYQLSKSRINYITLGRLL